MCSSPKDFIKEYSAIVGYILIAVIGFIFYNSYPQETTVVIRILAFLCNALFIILAVRLFHRYKKFLQTNFSNIDKSSFNWMKFLVFGLIILLSGALILVVFREVFSFPVSLYNMFAIIVLLFVNILGFRGIKHSTIFSQTVIPYNNQAQTEKQPATDKEHTSSYANYGLKQDDAIFLSGKLKSYMVDEKPYTNMDLTLKDLASALDTYPHYITQMLNTVFNQNFYDFINTYRVEEVQKRLHDPQFKNFTILAIAYDCGFNSKSSFNRIFKQKTRLTPSEYRNR
jgi:AraC-like DNA-binding protein